jgi:hypothetical protein
MGRSSMGAYKKLAGQERQMAGAFSVDVLCRILQANF